MTFSSNHRSASALVLASTLGLGACDLGPKSIGNQPDTGADEAVDTGEDDTASYTEGADQGTDSDTGDDDPIGGACGGEVKSIITDLDVIPPGFESSVADLIAQAEGSYEGTFEWFMNDGPLDVAHAGTSSPLFMAIDHLDGEIRFTEVELAGEFPNGQDGGEPCSNHLEIDVDLWFATEDGLFAESLSIPLDAYSHSEDTAPSFDLELDMDTHMGSLSVDDIVVTDGSVEALYLSAHFPGDQSQGLLGIEVSMMGWAGFGFIASFTADRVDP